MKLITVVGTRPEIIRLACIIKAADKYFDHVFVHTGQNWDKQLSDIFIEEFGIRKPDHFLNVVGEDLGETMANVISKTYKLFKELKPDCLLILGDTNSSLCAISAKRLKIPIFHMEAGNRCFDINVPEEINRKIVDHISDVNLPYTENSRRYLLNEGFRGDHIFVTGSPLAEVIYCYMDKIKSSTILDTMGLVPGQYILLSCHREENLDIASNWAHIKNTIDAVCDKFSVPIIFSTHPRMRNKIKCENIVFSDLVRNVEPFGFFDYCKLQSNAMCVLSDSGSVSEESAIMNFPAVSFRTSTERPECVDKGNIIIGGIRAEYVIPAIIATVGLHAGIDSVDSVNSVGSIDNVDGVSTGVSAGVSTGDSVGVSTRGSTISRQIVKPTDYIDQNVSEKVIKIIQGFTPIINTMNWRK